MGPSRGAGPRASAAGRGPVGKEVGEAWEGKVETENGGPGTRAGAAPRRPATRAGAERSEAGGIPWGQAEEKNVDTETQEEHHVIPEAEIGVSLPQAKEHQGSLASSRSQEKEEINKEVQKAPTNVLSGLLLVCIIASDENMKPLE
uniref:Uncharacterized protein n=1 Tax=Rangifer tarandus platyrhynchus TaxID=3082113 RepID=A0ACB0E5M2_RANTA|nr:unnamed protein product [Rangifer tarandus platyrhynchus]